MRDISETLGLQQFLDPVTNERPETAVDQALSWIRNRAEDHDVRLATLELGMDELEAEVAEVRQLRAGMVEG